MQVSAQRGDGNALDFVCYLHDGWRPVIRPAPSTRRWMEETPEQFAYRCLPLNIANAHGWEVLCPCDVQACWTGGARPDDVIVRSSSPDGPVALFGQGILTFHISALFQTPPGWSLWVTGSPNAPKRGLSPLTGIVETDWSPYTFTMNWKFTRRNHWVRFAAGEPICFFFPVERSALPRMRPRFAPLSDNPRLRDGFLEWTQSRNSFHREMADGASRAPAEKWQKRYYRGVNMDDETEIPDHVTKLRVREFTAEPEPKADNPPQDTSAITDLLVSLATAVRERADVEMIQRTLIAFGLSAVDAGRVARSFCAAQPDGPAETRHTQSLRPTPDASER